MKWPLSSGIYCRWVILFSLFAQPVFSQENSIRFYGNGFTAPDHDRIKIPITAGSPVNVTGDFTIECWIKCSAASNTGFVDAQPKADGWITGNIFIDRDVYGSAEEGGDYGLSIGSGKNLPSGQRVVAFGIDRMGTGITLRGNTQVADNNWHHIAVTRNATTGEVKLFVDGAVDASGYGPAGNIAYDPARATAYPGSDPFIVLGAEKHDAGTAYPGFNGQMDELRVSDIIRYSNNFIPATIPFVPDSNTVGLYHFNEGSGLMTADASGIAGSPSHGALHTGGSPGGPVWVSNSPFSATGIIRWQDINAKKQNQKVILSWSTEPTGRNTEFEVERSADGIRFNSIRLIRSQTDCKESCQYSFTDTHPLDGKNFYRVRNTSLAGEIMYSPTVDVLLTRKLSPFRISQNGNNLVVQNTSTIESLVIWNREGRRLMEKRNLSEGTTYVALQNSKGFAFVHISLPDGTRFTEKVVLR